MTPSKLLTTFMVFLVLGPVLTAILFSLAAFFFRLF
jgi:hypothetical protein